MNESVVHLAGPAITACGRVIQRCSLCGEKLCDSLGAAMAVTPDDPEPKFPTWECGRLIRVEGEFPVRYILLDDMDKLPDDSCLFSMVE